MLFNEIILMINCQIDILVGDLETMVAMVGRTSGLTRSVLSFSIFGESHLNVFQWMLAHGGIPTEDSYGPYLGQDGYCRADKATVGLKIKVGFCCQFQT